MTSGWDRTLFEKRWAPVLVQLLTSNGTADGQLQIADAFQLRAKQLILLKSNTQSTIQVEVKRVTSKTTFFVGRKGEGIDDRIDVSNFLVADNTSIFNPDSFQPRPKISVEDFARAVYDEEPVVAIRSVMVDRGGRYIGSDVDSPFYVKLSDGSINIENLNADLRVQLSAKDNDPTAGDIHSSVRLNDGVEDLAINPDGSINVNITSSSTEPTIKTTYSEVTAVPTAVPTSVVTYTAPIGKTSYLQKVFVSGDNVATYKVKLNGVVIETVRTYFGGDLNAKADFSADSRGVLLNVSDVVLVEVEHTRPFVGDFNGRIQSIEV